MVIIENNSNMLEISCKVAFLLFLKCFCPFSHKLVQTWCVWLDTWHTTLFDVYYCVEMDRIKNNIYMLQIKC